MVLYCSGFKYLFEYRVRIVEPWWQNYNNIIDCILCVCWWGVDGNREKPLRHLKVIPSSLQTYSLLFVIDWKSIGEHMPDFKHSRNLKIFGQEPYRQALSTLKGRFGGSQSYIYIIMYWYRNGSDIANWLIKTYISFKLNWIEFINTKNGKHISQISQIVISCSLLLNIL